MERRTENVILRTRRIDVVALDRIKEGTRGLEKISRQGKSINI